MRKLHELAKELVTELKGEMGPDTEHLEYRFGNYSLPNWEQVFYKNGERRTISTKLYYLLLILVENAGQVVSKDDIIEAVWPRQVVTDTTLAKQVLRLRKLLKDHQRDQPFIETHRGIGYRFTPTVTLNETAVKNDNNSTTASQSQRAWPWLAGLFGVVLLALFLWVNNKPSSPSLVEAGSAAPIKVAVLPLGNDQDWLNKGGREYLAEKLSRDPQINSVSPLTKWLTQASGESLAIDLTAHGNINYSCLIGITEANGEYQADIKLRTDSEVLSATEIRAKSLPELFDRTNTWVRNNLSIHANLADLAPESAALVDSYALQSYLQGMFELRANENRVKAGEFFQAAVTRDPDFFEAWSQLARNHLALGEFRQAISIAKTVLARSDVTFSPELQLDLNYTIGISYGRLHQPDEGYQYLNRATELITESNDPYAKLSALSALAALAISEKRWSDSEALINQSLDIAQSDYHLPNYLASTHEKLTFIIHNSGDPDRAVAHINEAIDLYKQTDNVNGLMRSYFHLTNYDYQMGFVDEGIQVLTEADPYLERSSMVYEKAFYMQNGGLLLNLRGQFTHADQYIKGLQTLAAQSSHPIYLFLGELVGVHQLYVQNRFSTATDRAIAIMSKFETEGSLQGAFPEIMALAILTSARGNPPADTRELMERFETDYHAHLERLNKELLRAKGHLAIREGRIDDGLQLLKESEDLTRATNNRHVADYIATERLEILLNYPDREYRQLLTSTEDSAGYGYLLWKLKAQFLAREGNYFEATRVMNENKLKANQLWTAEDQLLLEGFQARKNATDQGSE